MLPLITMSCLTFERETAFQVDAHRFANCQKLVD